MNTKRIFMPGDEWLYYKIYSGPKFLEELLLNQIYDLTHLLKANAQIDKFFFIRYSDDDGYHLRIRYHFTDAGNICNALGLVTEMMGPFVENRIVWKICIDSYSRELERYGKDAIELVETVFDISSFRVISHLRESAG
ncbi:MAG TPA: thiopeptide-type bacteriocin biosynthesis protein, partial [Puia sp.]|nr:thiopeptide-type bacteriocin biosynthesis protein [Puia sp.]